MAKTVSKKERKAKKVQEKAQFAEIDRRLEQERRQTEAAEVARLKLEAKLAYEAEQAWLKAEEERLAEESQSMRSFLEWRNTTLAKLEAEALAVTDWAQFLDTSGLPHPSREGDVHIFFDTISSTFDKSFNSLLQTLLNIHQVTAAAEELALGEDQKGNVKLAAKYRGYMQTLEQLASVRLDWTTNYLLQQSYGVWADKGKNIECGKIGSWKLALWVNHGKNPRFRVLELPEISVVLNLPKQFALANVAIRLLQKTANPLTRSRNTYMSLGGVFVIDVLALPIQTKVVKIWTLDFNLAKEGKVRNLGYPIPVVGQSTATAGQQANVLPIGVEMYIPTFIIHWNPSPEIGWWDAEEQCWQTTGITDIVRNGHTHKLTFTTIHAKPLAIIQSRVRQLPYKAWTISPTSSCTALLTLHTPVLDISLDIGEGWCKLLQPVIRELKGIQAQQLPPRVLLQHLSQCGLSLLPEDDDAPFVAASIKEMAFEKFVCGDLALTVPAFRLASSDFNKIQGSGVCVARLQEIPEALWPPSLEKSKVVKTMIYKPKGVTLLDYSDKLKDYPERLSTLIAEKLATYHASVLVSLQGVCSEESQNKMDVGNVAFTECVKDIAYALRLFSFGP
ncbi:unnamed protein product [Sphagnum compactum]